MTAQYSLHNNTPSSRKLLKMDVLTSETCWAVNWHNKTSVFKLVYLYSNLGTSLTNQNSIQEKIKSRLRSGNVWYHSVQNLSSSNFLSKNIKIKIHRIIILRVVLYGCETWSLTLREERRLRLFENRMLRRIFGPKRDEETEESRKLQNEGLNNFYSSPKNFRVIKSRMRWAGDVALCRRGEVHTREIWGKETTWETLT